MSTSNNVFIHQLSDVQTSSIGTDTKIWQFCVVLQGARIGANCNICANVLIENDVQIGNNVTVKSGVQLWDGVFVEDNVFIGPNATFTNDLVPRSKVYPKEFKKTFLKKGASIGANVTVVAGVTIGAYSFIGAGSVVTKDIPAYTVWYGNPVRHKGYITEEGVMMNLDLLDEKENQLYRLIEGKPIKIQ